jgi:ribose transport system ATP-binding protein
MENTNELLKLQNITKVFPGVKALDDVHLDICKGEIHALCGENGAGKSTLMKIIAGAQSYTSGKMFFDGHEVKFSSTKEAQDLGISMIYQEFNLIPHLSIAENIFLGRQPIRKNGFIDWTKLMIDAKKILQTVGLDIDPRTEVKNISVAQTQMVEIAKCLSMNSKIIIMDEPTAALADEEIQCLFDIIENLKKLNISIIYISHRMEEIFKITQRITVFRDGKYIKTLETKNTDHDEIVRLMVGKNITDLYPKRGYKPSEVVLEVQNININRKLKNVSLRLQKGEILGIAGLMGSGNILLSKVLSGYYEKYNGKILLENKEINIKKPIDAIKNGISIVPDDRKNEGLVLIRNVRENITLASLDSVIKNNFIDYNAEIEKTNKKIKQLNIKVSSSEQTVGNLSGGNQQKVVFAKMLETKPKILILAEPTRGIDVGAKSEIYKIMNELTENGISIILISSDLPELIGMSDRVLVMREGRIISELKKEELSQEIVLSYAAGGKTNE